jgi:hypothetical protein
LLLSSSIKAEPMVPEEPITSARNGWGISGINKGGE